MTAQQIEAITEFRAFADRIGLPIDMSDSDLLAALRRIIQSGRA